MRKTFLATLCVAVLTGGQAASEEFPSQATYLFYVQGALAGKSDIAFTTEGTAYVFASTTEVGLGGSRQSFSCRSEFDKNTLRPRFFRYEGTQDGKDFSGTVRFDADSAKSTRERSGLKTSSRVPWSDASFVFENYVPEHLAVLVRQLAASGRDTQRLSVLLPSQMMLSPGLAAIESEVEIPTRPAPVVCKKYIVSLQNTSPFYLYLHPKQNSLIYMDFPANQTEVFLESAFGNEPKTRYKAPSKPQSQD